jgi:hypothetical protein
VSPNVVRAGREDGEAVTRICEECGNNGEGGEIEYADGRLAHFRKFPDDGKPHPIMCFGKFVEKEDA